MYEASITISVYNGAFTVDSYILATSLPTDVGTQMYAAYRSTKLGFVTLESFHCVYRGGCPVFIRCNMVWNGRSGIET